MPYRNLPETKMFDDDGLDRPFLDEYDDPDKNGICKLLRPRWAVMRNLEGVRGKVTQNLNGMRVNGKSNRKLLTKASSIVVSEEVFESLEPDEDEIDYSSPDVKTNAEISSYIDRHGSL